MKVEDQLLLSRTSDIADLAGSDEKKVLGVEKNRPRTEAEMELTRVAITEESLN